MSGYVSEILLSAVYRAFEDVGLRPTSEIYSGSRPTVSGEATPGRIPGGGQIRCVLQLFRCWPVIAPLCAHVRLRQTLKSLGVASGSTGPPHAASFSE